MVKPYKIGFLFIAILIGVNQLNAQSFKIFEHHLKLAVAERDTTLLNSLLAEYVVINSDICGVYGCKKGDFIKYFFGHPFASEVWSEWERVLSFGFHEDSITYFQYTNQPEFPIYRAPDYLQNVNNLDTLWVLGKNIPVFNAPSENSEVITYLTKEIVTCDCMNIFSDSPAFVHSTFTDFLRIKTESGEEGYINVLQTSYSITMEFEVAKINGEWKLIACYVMEGD